MTCSNDFNILLQAFAASGLSQVELAFAISTLTFQEEGRGKEKGGEEGSIFGELSEGGGGVGDKGDEADARAARAAAALLQQQEEQDEHEELARRRKQMEEDHKAALRMSQAEDNQQAAATTTMPMRSIANNLQDNDYWSTSMEAVAAEVGESVESAVLAATAAASAVVTAAADGPSSSATASSIPFDGSSGSGRVAGASAGTSANTASASAAAAAASSSIDRTRVPRMPWQVGTNHPEDEIDIPFRFFVFRQGLDWPSIKSFNTKHEKSTLLPY